MVRNVDDMIVAVDGPAASGKSTVSLCLARKLGMRLVDSGSMYRAVTLMALEKGISPEDGEALSRLAEEVKRCFKLEVSEKGSPSVKLGSRDVSGQIRSAEVGNAVSAVSEHPVVRDKMVTLQRDIVAEGGAVVEGRDIGTTVFPEADVKVFLDATLEERVKRRYLELEGKGISVSVEQVEFEIKKRDAIDSGRTASPLSMASDAVRIDSTKESVANVVDEIVDLCSRKGRTAR